MVIIAVSKNDYRLSGSDTNWVDNNIHYFTPKVFISKLLQLKFDNSEKYFNSELALAKACIELTKKNSYMFQNNPIDKSVYEAFLKLNIDQPNNVIRYFHTLWSGYTDEDLNEAKQSITQDKKMIRSLIAEVKEENNNYLERLNEPKSQRAQIYINNKKKLKEIELEIGEVFKETNKLARQKLSYMVSYRRKKYLRNFDLIPDDYTGLKYRLRQCDPKETTFPLRFFIHLSSGNYLNLLNKWRDGHSKEDLLNYLNENIEWSNFLDDLVLQYKRIADLLIRDRTTAFEEIQKTWSNQCYLATILLAITQLEGILWDFSNFLNSTNIKIYELIDGVKRPYEWDIEELKYKKVDLNGQSRYSGGKELASIRKLLLETRLGSIISCGIYSYLIDEFYDDRSCFVHGDIDNRNWVCDAVGALLCLMTCLIEISNFSNQSEGI